MGSYASTPLWANQPPRIVYERSLLQHLEPNGQLKNSGINWEAPSRLIRGCGTNSSRSIAEYFKTVHLSGIFGTDEETDSTLSSTITGLLAQTARRKRLLRN